MCPRAWLKGGDWGSAWREGSRLLKFENGSEIRFYTYVQYKNDPGSYGGDDLDAVYMDEHGPEGAYIENSMRLVDRNGYLVCTMTPEEGMTWEQDHVEEPPDGLSVDHWFFSTEKNPHLSVEGIAAVKALITDEKLAAAKLHGQFVSLSGMVFPQFNRALSVIPDFDMPDWWFRVFAIDCHIKAPHALLWGCWTPEGEFIVYRTMKMKGTPAELKHYIRAKTHEHIHLWLGDEPMGGQGTNVWGCESILSMLQSGVDGFPIVQVPRQTEKYFDAGIMKMRQMFQRNVETKRPGILIFKSCDYPLEKIDGKNCGSLVWELLKYQYRRAMPGDEETLREKIRNIDDHLIACTRYSVQTGPVGIDSQKWDFKIGGYGG